LGETEFHHRQQTVPARNEFGLIAQFLKKTDRVFDAFGPVIFEWRWIHAQSPTFKGLS
jgi:hypothetical protein